MTITALVVAVLIVIFLLGPRATVDTTVAFDPGAICPDPEAYLAKREAAIKDIQPGLQKEIFWADPIAKTKTRLSIVYVHGFSASKGEIRPLPDRVAATLGANLFHTRLTGHGEDGAAMAMASVNAWINHYAEAVAIGRAIGDNVVVIGTSTGASLATWAIAQSDLSDGVVAFVAISPNYGLKAAGSSLLTLPSSKELAELLVGKERGFKPVDALNAYFWTTKYPTSAVLPLAALTKLAYKTP